MKQVEMGSKEGTEELEEALGSFADGLATLVWTDTEPFSSGVVTMSACETIRELLGVMAAKELGLEELRQLPLWQAASWVVAVVGDSLEDSGDPALKPLLVRARETEAQLR